MKPIVLQPNEKLIANVTNTYNGDIEVIINYAESGSDFFEEKNRKVKIHNNWSLSEINQTILENTGTNKLVIASASFYNNSDADVNIGLGIDDGSEVFIIWQVDCKKDQTIDLESFVNQVISSWWGGGDTYKVKVDETDTPDYLGNKVDNNKIVIDGSKRLTVNEDNLNNVVHLYTGDVVEEIVSAKIFSWWIDAVVLQRKKTEAWTEFTDLTFSDENWVRNFTIRNETNWTDWVMSIVPCDIANWNYISPFLWMRWSGNTIEDVRLWIWGELDPQATLDIKWNLRIQEITQDNTQNQILVIDSTTKEVKWRDAATLWGWGGGAWIGISPVAKYDGELVIWVFEEIQAPFDFVLNSIKVALEIEPDGENAWTDDITTLKIEYTTDGSTWNELASIDFQEGETKTNWIIIKDVSPSSTNITENTRIRFNITKTAANFAWANLKVYFK